MADGFELSNHGLETRSSNKSMNGSEASDESRGRLCPENSQKMKDDLTIVDNHLYASIAEVNDGRGGAGHTTTALSSKNPWCQCETSACS